MTVAPCQLTANYARTAGGAHSTDRVAKLRSPAKFVITDTSTNNKVEGMSQNHPWKPCE